MASLAVEELEKITPKRVLYFYCRYDDLRKQTFVAMTCSFLQQLLRTDDIVVAQLYETAISDGNYSLTSRKLAESVLEICLKAVGGVSIVLDGLDECPDVEQKAIALWLRKYIDSSSSEPEPSRCLFLSQRDEKIENLLSGLPTIQMSVSDNRKDIEAYCQARVVEFPDRMELSDTEREQIATTISERAQGNTGECSLISSIADLYQRHVLVRQSGFGQPSRTEQSYGPTDGNEARCLPV